MVLSKYSGNHRDLNICNELFTFFLYRDGIYKSIVACLKPEEEEIEKSDDVQLFLA